MCELKLIGAEPPHKQNFIAIFGDGSGCVMYCWLDSGEIVDAEGDLCFEADDLQGALQDCDYCWWMPLPDNFDFFFKDRQSS